MESAAFYEAKLRDISRECVNNSEYAKREEYRFDIATQHIDLGIEALNVPPIGSGMTSEALNAVAANQEEIKSTLSQHAAAPAVAAILDTKQSFSKA